MKLLVAVCSLAVGLGVCGFSSASAQAEPKVLGGITPDRRPEGLPVVGAPGMSDADQKRALHGVAQPPPASLEMWLDDQGRWFTPFTHPGMTGPYDIRNWHGKSNG